MKIMNIHMENLKGFSGFHAVALDGKSTVIFGENGVGKSTLLDAVNYALYPVIYRLNNAQGKNYQSMAVKLIHRGADGNRAESVAVGVNLETDGEAYLIGKLLKAQNNGNAVTALTVKSIKEYTEQFEARYLADERQEKPVDMPVFVNYGTNRSVLVIPQRIRNRHEFLKRVALEYALENRMEFKTFFEWFQDRDMYERTLQEAQRSFDVQDPSLQAVRQAIRAMMGDSFDIKMRYSPQRMVAVKDGVELDIELLSDGEKCTLSLIGDIARRLVLANPSREKPFEGEGVVLIDEIDLHMHPAWQRKILRVLKETFPNIQFIVTTHSPQVLGEVDDSYKLLRLTRDNGEISIEESRTYGKDTNSILFMDMHVIERTDEVRKMLEAFHDAVDQHQKQRAKEILEWLETNIEGDSEISSCSVEYDLEFMEDVEDDPDQEKD